jgi:hypothetical protein
MCFSTLQKYDLKHFIQINLRISRENLLMVSISSHWIYRLNQTDTVKLLFDRKNIDLRWYD